MIRHTRPPELLVQLHIVTFHFHPLFSMFVFIICFDLFFFYFLLEDQEDEIGDDYKEFGMSKNNFLIV